MRSMLAGTIRATPGRADGMNSQMVYVDHGEEVNSGHGGCLHCTVFATKCDRRQHH